MTASGSNLSYQWYQGENGDTSTPVGANGDSFTTPPLTTTTTYWVRVSNPAGTANSDVAIITVVENSLIGSVILEGRPTPPSAQLVVSLHVKIVPVGEVTPVFDDTVTTDEQGEFLVTGLQTGTYDIYVKYDRSLQLAATITLVLGENSVALGELRTGDADGNNLVNLTDFSLLAATFGKQAGDGGYDERADFNGDGVVNLLDFSLLATNFGQAGDS